MGFLSVSSAVLIFCAGLGVIVSWTVVSGDRYFKDENCGGCIYLFHQVIDEAPSALRTHYRLSRDAYPYLLTFGIICGAVWIATAFLVGRVRYYLVLGIAGAVAFVCVFVALLQRMRGNQLCWLYASVKESQDLQAVWNAECKSEEHWQVKHMYDSYDLFWGSSVAFMFMSIYQIGCAIALVYEEENFAFLAKCRESELERLEDAKKVDSDSNLKLQSSKRSEGEEVKEVPREKYTKCKTRDQEVSTHGLMRDESVLGTPCDVLASTAVRMSAASVVVRRGQMPPPEESPVPSLEPPDFSMSNS